MTRKRIVISLLIIIALKLTGWGCVWLLLEGEHRNEKVMRYARMIDTNAQHTQHKGNHYYNTYGYFVDRETGLHFSDGIGDSLYRQFERDGNKPIEVLWPYSIDKREHTSIGVFYVLFGGVGLLVTIIIAGFLLASEIKRIVEQRKNGRH